MYKVGIDVMSGERSSAELIEGGLRALDDFKELHIYFVGHEKVIKQALDKTKYSPKRITLIHAEDRITMMDSPVQACRRKPNSSLMVGLRALKEDIIDSFFSPGNTGATLTGALMTVGRLHGVKRPAIIGSFPSEKGYTTVLDLGANAECTPRYLRQFAIMGYNYYKILFQKEAPSIGLMNIGEEPDKGNDLVIKAHKTLERLPYRFVGNVEPHDVFQQRADVIICDGFTGNIILKTSEAIMQEFFRNLKSDMQKSLKAKLGLLFLKQNFRAILEERMNVDTYGGALLIGTKKSVCIGHGKSSQKATYNAIKFCIRTLKLHLIEHIEKDIQKWG